jgi:putative ABC transport system substrate-binding protein
MKKQITILTLWAMLLALYFPAEAQQPGKIPRIGYLTQRGENEPQELAFKKGLGELGYFEGQNVFIEWRFAKGKADLLPELAAELVRLKSDCIIAVGINAIRAARQATDTIPIVMANASDDPVRLGLVASLARPGGNVTGFTDISSDLAGKRLELLKEVVPKASRVAVVWDARSPSAVAQFREAETAARALRVQLQSLEVRRPDDFQNAFQAASKSRADAFIVSTSGIVNSHRALIVDLAIKTRLPAMYTNSVFVPAGGLMSYGADIPDQFRRAATYVDKILKGTKPAGLPVQQPMKFELVINLRTAKQIGLTIPPNVLARADRVIR